MNPAPLRIAVLTDGNAGNRTQALGLAEAIARRRPAEIAEPPLRLPRLLDPWPNLLLSRLPVPVPDVPADLVIGAGRRGNLAAARLRRPGRRAVAVLNPQMRLSAFDAVVAPEHDGLAGADVLATLGAMNRLTPAAIASAPRPFPDLPAPRLAILIGGPSRSAAFDREAAALLLADLGRFGGWSLTATLSRRSPPWLAPLLRAALPALWLWDGGGGNPYPGLLCGAAAVLVTEDSVNMASEAAATGLPVFVSGAGRVAPKLARFHAALRDRGHARPASAAPAGWRPSPLDEAGRIAALLLARFGFS